MPSKTFGPTNGTADTETQIGSAYTVPIPGAVRRIRISGYNGVADKAGSGVLIVYSDRQTGPFEFATHIGAGLTDVYSDHVDEILAPGLSLTQGEILTIKYKGAEAHEEITISIEWG